MLSIQRKYGRSYIYDYDVRDTCVQDAQKVSKYQSPRQDKGDHLFSLDSLDWVSVGSAAADSYGAHIRGQERLLELEKTLFHYSIFHQLWMVLRLCLSLEREAKMNHARAHESLPF